ncbi:MAG: methyl-accepting chemotaxis protein [Paracoccaceae bacterium]
MRQKITSSLTQLSMLSINARIEAARSGDAGLGFAMVADDMKPLAEHNTKWARLIESKLDIASAKA